MKSLPKKSSANDAITVLPVDASDHGVDRRDSDRAARLAAVSRQPDVLRVIVATPAGDREQGLVRALAGLDEYDAMVAQAHSVEEARHILSESDFDIALVDDGLGDGGGLRFIRDSGGRRSQTPFVVLTRGGSSEAHRTAMAVGAYDSLTIDDLSPKLLCRVVRHVLHEHQLYHRLQRAERDNRELARVAGIASEAKTQFLSQMSHDLRTPLNAILGFSDVIRRRSFGADLDRYTEYADLIYASGDSLRVMIDDLLDLSLGNTGKLQMHFEGVDLVEVVREVIAGAEPQVRAKRLTTRIDADADVAHVFADRQRVHQMVANLLSNAIKYTPEEGALTVGVRGQSDCVELFVSDTGMGIPREAIDKVTQPFHQMGDPMIGEVSGMSVGLALVKFLVERHGGALLVQSREGLGTTVCLRFPRVEPIP